MEQIFIRFKNSVLTLSDKLAQWNKKEDLERLLQSSIASLYEETGEISGLISKYRIRKHYYNCENIENLIDYDVIKDKFIDELGDLFWVTIASCYNIFKNNNRILEDFDKEFVIGLTSNDYDNTTYIYKSHTSLKTDKKIDFIGLAIMNVMHNITSLKSDLIFYNNDLNTIIEKRLKTLIYSVCCLFYFIAKEYKINIDIVFNNNMQKLGFRYDEEGNRVD